MVNRFSGENSVHIVCVKRKKKSRQTTFQKTVMKTFSVTVAMKLHMQFFLSVIMIQEFC